MTHIIGAGSAVEGAPAPDGFTRDGDSLLYTREGTTRDPVNVTEANAYLLGLEEEFGRSSMAPDIMHNMLDYMKEERDGVTYYNFRGFNQEQAEEMADIVLSRASYQITKRQFKMDDRTAEGISRATDANGTKYEDIGAMFYMGISRDMLTDAFAGTKNVYQTTLKLTQDMTQQYVQRTDVEGITHTFGREDVPGIRGAITDLDSSLKLNALGETQIQHLGYEELLKAYLQLLGMGREKQYKMSSN